MAFPQFKYSQVLISVMSSDPAVISQKSLVLTYCSLSLLLLLLVPYLSFFFSAAVLINSKISSRTLRLCLATAMIISLSMMNAARPLVAGEANDMDGYYYVYQMLALGDLSYITHFGGGLNDGIGLEIGLPMLLYLFAITLPIFTVSGLMFALSMFGTALLMMWINKSFYSRNNNHLPALMGVAILMLNVYFATQLTRQYLSLIILLYAFVQNNSARQWALVLLASMFHITAIGFYLIYKLIRRGAGGCLLLFFGLSIFSIFFGVIITYVNYLPDSVVEKFAYYRELNDGYTLPDIASMRMILLLCALSFLIIIVTGSKASGKLRSWLMVPWIAEGVHLILLPFPLLSLRTTLLVHSILPGVIAGKMLENTGGKIRILMPLIFNSLLIYKALIYALDEKSGNLMMTADIIRGFF